MNAKTAREIVRTHTDLDTHRPICTECNQAKGYLEAIAKAEKVLVHALGAILVHQRIVAGEGMAELSTTANIAQKALEEWRKETGEAS